MEPRTVPPTQERTAARFLLRGDLAGSVYGIILVSALLVTAEESVQSAGERIPLLLVTTLVFAAAHAWSKTLAESAGVSRPRRFARQFGHEWPIVQAAFPACIIILLLADIGTWEVSTAIGAAVYLNVVLLFVWGVALRHLEGGTRLQLLLAGMASGGFGLVLVGLKVLVH